MTDKSVDKSLYLSSPKRLEKESKKQKNRKIKSQKKVTILKFEMHFSI